jgi:hypothetical protein
MGTFYNSFTESYYMPLQEYPSSWTSCHAVYTPYACGAIPLILSINVYTGFLEVCDVLPHFTPILFSSIWRMYRIWPVVDLSCRDPHWWSPIISYVYVLNLERKIFDKNYMTLIEVIFCGNYYSQFCPSFCKSVQCRPLSMIRQPFLILIELMSLWVWDGNVSSPAWISSGGVWSLPGDVRLSKFVMPVSTSKGLRSGTNGSAICISIWDVELRKEILCPSLESNSGHPDRTCRETDWAITRFWL